MSGDDNMRQSDKDISQIKMSLARIETLLVGENGSGLCARMTKVEEKVESMPDKIKKEITDILEKASQKKATWIGIAGCYVGIIISSLIAWFKK